jgi:hypothetical protein
MVVCSQETGLHSSRWLKPAGRSAAVAIARIATAATILAVLRRATAIGVGYDLVPIMGSPAVTTAHVTSGTCCESTLAPFRPDL